MRCSSGRGRGRACGVLRDLQYHSSSKNVVAVVAAAVVAVAAVVVVAAAVAAERRAIEPRKPVDDRRLSWIGDCYRRRSVVVETVGCLEAWP